MNYSKIISLIGFIKPKNKKQNIMSYSTINMTKLEINNTLANYFNFTNFLKIHYTLQTKICIMNFILVIIKNITKPKKFGLLSNKKQKINKLSFLLFQFYYPLIAFKNINKKQSFFFPKRDILDQIFVLTLKQFKKFFFKKIIKQIQKLLLSIKQKIKQNSYNNVNFFIKIINLKIINTFKIFCTFLNIFDFFKKITYFMHKQKNFFYKIKSFFNTFFSCNKVKIFYYQIAKLQHIFYKIQNKLEDKQFYKLVIKEFYFTIPFFPKKICFHFYLKKYYEKLDFLKNFLNFFLFFKKKLFYNYNLFKNNLLFMCLRKKIQKKKNIYLFPLTKVIKIFVDFFYFDQQNIIFNKSKLQKVKKKNNVWFKLNTNKILVNLRNSQVVNLQFIFQFIMRYIKIIYNKQYFFNIKSFFLKKIKKIILKLASFIRFFLCKLFWKWGNKQHPQNSSKSLIKKYWIFLQNFSMFYFFEKANLKF